MNQRNRIRESILLIAAIALLGGGTASAQLVSQYTFETDTTNTTGAAIADNAGSNGGALIGDAIVTTTVDPSRGNVLTLDGSGDYGSVASSASLQFNSAVSLTGWFMETGSTGSGSGLVAKENQGSQHWGIEIDNNAGVGGQTRFFVWGPNTSQLATTPSQNAWHHIVGTYDDATDTQNTYIDGILAVTQSDTGTITTGNDPLTIGRTRISGDAIKDLQGSIDDVGVYSSALTAEEVALIYGLNVFSNIDQADPGIADVLAAFNAGPGNSGTAGADDWLYALAADLGTSPVDPIGTIGGSIVTEDAFIVLDSSGNGVQLSVAAVPEPASVAMWLLLGIGGASFAVWRRRRR